MHMLRNMHQTFFVLVNIIQTYVKYVSLCQWNFLCSCQNIYYCIRWKYLGLIKHSLFLSIYKHVRCQDRIVQGTSSIFPRIPESSQNERWRLSSCSRLLLPQLPSAQPPCNFCRWHLFYIHTCRLDWKVLTFSAAISLVPIFPFSFSQLWSSPRGPERTRLLLLLLLLLLPRTVSWLHLTSQKNALWQCQSPTHPHHRSARHGVGQFCCW